MSFVTQSALGFIQAAVLPNGEITENFSWKDYTDGHDALLFFYPLDFTFVCPSELIALNKRMELFEKRGVKVVALSIDSVHTHAAWRNTPIEKGGIGPLKFPLVSDIDHEICRYYKAEHPTAKVALRSAILVDKEGIIRAEITCDLPLGRNIDELLRLFDAIQFNREHGEVCPAGWQQGKDGMKADAAGVENYLKTHADAL